MKKWVGEKKALFRIIYAFVQQSEGLQFYSMLSKMLDFFILTNAFVRGRKKINWQRFSDHITKHNGAFLLGKAIRFQSFHLLEDIFLLLFWEDEKLSKDGKKQIKKCFQAFIYKLKLFNNMSHSKYSLTFNF